MVDSSLVQPGVVATRPDDDRSQDSPGADAALVRAARRDPAAFASLYRRYVTPIYRYLYSRVGQATAAEDLTAQVFVEALEGLAGYHERGHFAAWLFTIARRKAADHFRRRRPHLPLNEALDSPAGAESPLTGLVRQEALQRLAVLVAGLNEDQQELLRLRFAGGLTYGQIGVVVGRSEAAVKMAVHRLLRRLEARWEERDE
jgi:RNA polymerase sigma-70 factor (ECF subfamily)